MMHPAFHQIIPFFRFNSLLPLAASISCDFQEWMLSSAIVRMAVPCPLQRQNNARAGDAPS
jgi:hypothetical protein